MKFILCFFLLLASSAAYARLGDSEASVERDSQAFQGARRMSQHKTHRLHEITTDANHIREFVNSDGVVFAVAWDGLANPDLTRILGAYYSEFLAADQGTPNPVGRGPKEVRSSNLVGMRFGHMRDVHGKAYIPALVPPGFDLSLIQ